VIVVDSSVWIGFFRGEATPEVRGLFGLLDTETIILGDLVLYELLQGIRSQRDLVLVEDFLGVCEVVAMVGHRAARRAAANYRALRDRGVTVRKSIDVLIATWCLDNGAVLLHRDRDFDPFVAHLGLRVWIRS
jgi:predicted nucleic acid-binding protein